MALERDRWCGGACSPGDCGCCASGPGYPGFGRGAAVLVGDTKNRALAVHRYPAAAWTAFLTGIRAGDFPRP